MLRGLLILLLLVRYLPRMYMCVYLVLDEVALTHKILDTLFAVLPVAFNVLVVALVLLLVFSVVGMELFCILKHG